MNKYAILTDSSADLTKEILADADLSAVQLDVLIEGETSLPNCDVDIKGLYDKMRNKKSATTSAASIDKFTIAMDKLLADGFDVLYIGFSSGLSGTYNAGFVAAQELSEKYPDRKIYTVDTLAASLGEGLLVYLAVQKKNSGASIEEVRDYIEENKLHMCHWFTVDDLVYLKRGGRVSATTAIVGNMLNIKPVMHMDNAGKLINVTKARGRKASIDALLERMKQTAINPSEQTVFISHGDCIEDAEYLAERIKAELGVKDIRIGYVGAVIGAHSGPGTLALFFLGTER